MTRTKSTRAAAVRRAQQAKQTRDARALARDRKVQDTLTDFYEQIDRAEQLRGQAAARAGRIVADAEQEAAKLRGSAAASVAQLDALGETRAAIVELTRLSPGEVRELLALARCVTPAATG